MNVCNPTSVGRGRSAVVAAVEEREGGVERRHVDGVLLPRRQLVDELDEVLLVLRRDERQGVCEAHIARWVDERLRKCDDRNLTSGKFIIFYIFHNGCKTRTDKISSK